MLCYLIISLFVFLGTISSAAADFSGFVYMIPWNTTKTMEWSPPDVGPAPDGYDFYIQRLEDGKTLATGKTTLPSVPVNFRSHGHDLFWIRAFRMVDGIKQVGEWTNSLQIGTVGGLPQPWVVFVMQP